MGRTIFMATSLYPRFSNRAMISPVSPRWTPSGLQTREASVSPAIGTGGSELEMHVLDHDVGNFRVGHGGDVGCKGGRDTVSCALLGVWTSWGNSRR